MKRIPQQCFVIVLFAVLAACNKSDDKPAPASLFSTKTHLNLAPYTISRLLPVNEGVWAVDTSGFIVHLTTTGKTVPKGLENRKIAGWYIQADRVWLNQKRSSDNLLIEYDLKSGSIVSETPVPASDVLAVHTDGTVYLIKHRFAALVTTATLHILKAGKTTSIPVPGSSNISIFQPRYVHKMVFGADGRLWIVTGNALFMYDPAKGAVETQKYPTTQKSYSADLVFDGAAFWVAYGVQFWKKSGEQWQNIPYAYQIGDGTFRNAQFYNGKVWFFMGDFIVNSEAVVYRDLPEDIDIRSGAIDAKGVKWISTTEHGIFYSDRF